jgi:hypothetical protein
MESGLGTHIFTTRIHMDISTLVVNNSAQNLVLHRRVNTAYARWDKSTTITTRREECERLTRGGEGGGDRDNCTTSKV